MRALNSNLPEMVSVNIALPVIITRMVLQEIEGLE